MYEWILAEAESLREEMRSWREELHQIPELGLELPQTSAYVQKRLTEMGIPFKTLVNGSCVEALLGKAGPCIMLRADMDALPMKEESGEPFASQNGCMHACGHDMHAAVLLGTAKILKAHEAELEGQVKLVFQPGEEIFAGAAAAIQDGVMENPHVDAAMGMHVSAMSPLGFFAYGKTSYAAVYGFKITLTGKGCHGSNAASGIDPINTGVHIYLGLQELLARECPGSETVSLTLGQFTAGTVANVIPETAVLQGTLRTLNNDMAEMLIRRIGEVVEHVSAAYRTKADLEVLYQAPVCTCDAEMNDLVMSCARDMSLVGPVMSDMKSTGSDDFAYYSRLVPAAYLVYGAGLEDASARRGQHNPKVRFNPDALPRGAAVYAATAMEWLKRQKK